MNDPENIDTTGPNEAVLRLRRALGWAFAVACKLIVESIL